ncbi:hypothetical protein B9G54_02845 [Alloscardovia macacae]|nr:hypothetical protein B9G54_02845 [Alloscardovia macacae]
MRLSSTVKNGMLLCGYIGVSVVLSLWLGQYTAQGSESAGGLNFLGEYTWILPLAALVVIGGSFLLALRFIGTYFVLVSFVELLTRAVLAAMTFLALDGQVYLVYTLRGVNIFAGMAASVLFLTWLLKPRMKNADAVNGQSQ